MSDSVLMNLSIEEIEQQKKKIRQYREVIDGERVPPAARVRQVFMTEDTPVYIRLRKDFTTHIKMPFEVKQENMAVGNHAAVKVEARGNIIYVTPQSTFNVTNLSVSVDGYTFMFILKEDYDGDSFDAMVQVNTDVGKVSVKDVIDILMDGAVSKKKGGVAIEFLKKSTNAIWEKGIKAGDVCFYLLNGRYIEDGNVLFVFYVNEKSTIIGSYCDNGPVLVRSEDGRLYDIAYRTK